MPAVKQREYDQVFFFIVDIIFVLFAPSFVLNPY